ncbi:MAG TPA: hypothetical protein VN176_17270 [Verrucomicrobiae bacterium]|jgi:hypothetical protein|nr:hypothetical protein [Verrucomicrobiae bacterium]
MTAIKFLVRWVVAFVAINVFGFIGHGWLLKGDYLSLSHDQAHFLRTEADGNAYMSWMLLAFAVLAAGMVWMYAKGNTGQSWIGQGIRFGIAVWLVSAVYSYLIYFAVQPWPPMLIAKEMGWDLVSFVLTALAIAALSSKDKKTA